MMDDATVQMLQTLLPDLLERGWQLVMSESRVFQSADGSRYRVVYVRPFDDRLDREEYNSATYDPRTRQRIVRVSTLKDSSPSWHAARQDAIRRMREADAKRRRNRGLNGPFLSNSSDTIPILREFSLPPTGAGRLISGPLGR